MIKNIQKHLLLHHPMIWNIRLIPMLIILFVAHLIFFAIGYFSTDVSFDKTYYRSPIDDFAFMYFFTVLVGILLFIGWMFFYSRNNALKTFYPRRPLQLYFEWLLILAIVAGMTFLPFTLTMGGLVRWQALASKSETRKVIELSNQVALLLPNDRSNYDYQSNRFEPLRVAESDKINIQDLNLDDYSLEYTSDNQVILKGYIGYSLLFYEGYYKHYSLGFETYMSNNEKYGYDYSHSNDSEIVRNRKNVMQVKHWLREGKKDSILNLMDTYLKLLDKHNLKHNIDKHQWFDRIYNPPYFKVSQHNFILDTEPNEYGSSYYDNGDYYTAESNMPYMQFKELKSAYENVQEAHSFDEEFEILLLVCMCFAIALSIFVFSFRVTSGRAWLTNFVLTGVTLFVSILFTAIIASSGDDEGAVFMYLFLWLAIFALAAIMIIGKAFNGGNKGRSNIYLNLFLWMIPCLLPLIFFEFFVLLEMMDNNSLDEEYIIYNVFVINILVTIGLMLPVSFLVHKWKSIPEE